MDEIGCYPINSIVQGAAAALGTLVPDKSIDLIFTDPPYPYEFIECYSDLSWLAARVLKDDALLLAYSGQTYLPEVIERLSEHLIYRWTIAVLHGSSQIVWGSRMIAGWKPILVYGTRAAAPDDDIIHDIVMPSHRDKRFHEWGQSDYEAIKYIDRLTEPGDIVLDPFCGGGTTPAAAKMLRRRYLAFEIDKDTCAGAVERLKYTPVNLPIDNGRQALLFEDEVLTQTEAQSAKISAPRGD